MTDTTLVMIGCGNMGSALLKGWAQGSFAERLIQVDVVKPTPPSDDVQIPGVTFHTSLSGVTHTPDVVVWAVKPDQLEMVIPQSIKQFGKTPLYISIAAGKTLDNLKTYVGGSGCHIIRAMPNTPVAVNLGITGLCATGNVLDEQQLLVEELFASVGTAVWIDETQMNLLTALCGSGPAYVYYFMECLTNAAIELGLDDEAADMLTRQMVLGAAELAIDSEETLAALRQNITSPGGTTEAALDIWMQQGTLGGQAKEALQTALERAAEIQGS